MLWTIAKKEIVSNLLSYKFFIVLLLIVVLIFTSFFIMHRDFKNRLSDYQVIRPKPGEPIALLAPNPLSIFAKGLDEALTRSFEIGVIGITVRAGQKSGNIIFSFFPTPDFLYIVRVVLSLVALLFGFDQVSREKEMGTLRLMLANTVSRAKVLLGKWLGNFFSLAVPFVAVTLLGVVFLSLDRDINFSSAHLLKLGFILVLTLVYIAFFLSLGLLISTRTKKAASSIVILLFIWALLVFIIPNLGTLLARQLVDVPSVRALSEKRQQVWTREVLLSIGERGNEQRGNWAKHVKTISDDNDRLGEDFSNKFNRLVNLSKNINRISPAASFVYAVTDIAGTGISEESNFKRDVVRYKDSVIQKMMSPVGSDSKANEYPAFTYNYRTLSQVFAQGALFDLAWLVFFNILFFALSYFAFVKYDVR